MKEFKNGQEVEAFRMGSWHFAAYIGFDSVNNQHVVSFACLDYNNVLDTNIRDSKPKETFIDIEITWNEFKGYIKHNENDMCLISNLDIGYNFSHGIVSCYIFDDHSDGKPNGCKILDDIPFLFRNDRKEIARKATHVRFIKIKESE